MFEQARSVVATLAGTLAVLEPESLGDEEAAELLGLAAQIERIGAGLRFLVAGRAVAGDRWLEEGHRSAASWVAAVSGTSVGDGRAVLETSERLVGLAAIRDAVRAGALSPTQVKAVTSAAAVDPVSEPDLLEAAATLSVERLQSFARDVRRCAAAGIDPEGLAEGRRRRYLRFWTEADGLLHLSGAFGAEAGAELVAAVRSRAAFVADEALAAGMSPEPQEAYDADALVALAVGDTRTATFAGNVGDRRRDATIVMHVSLEALRRGVLHQGELCEIPGAGPVSLSTVEGLLADASLALALHGGDDLHDVLGVVDLGRALSPAAARALEARDRTCVVPGCAVSSSLVTERWRADDEPPGSSTVWPAELSTLARLCRFHQWQRAQEGFRLSGGPGRWEWRGPP